MRRAGCVNAAANQKYTLILIMRSPLIYCAARRPYRAHAVPLPMSAVSIAILNQNMSMV